MARRPEPQLERQRMGGCILEAARPHRLPTRAQDLRDQAGSRRPAQPQAARMGKGFDAYLDLIVPTAGNEGNGADLPVPFGAPAAAGREEPAGIRPEMAGHDLADQVEVARLGRPQAPAIGQGAGPIRLPETVGGELEVHTGVAYT